MPRRLPSPSSPTSPATSAEIAFAFFADVAGENNYFVGAHAAFGKRASDGDEGGESRAVIGDAGANETIAVFLDAHFGAGGENGVEMRGEKNDAVGIRAG